jgi:flagellar motor switch protein FliN
MPTHQLLRLGRSAIIELDFSEEDHVHILANNMPVAKGTVIVSGNRFAVKVKELLPRAPGACQGRPAGSAPRIGSCSQTGDLLHPQRTPLRRAHPHMRSWRNW